MPSSKRLRFAFPWRSRDQIARDLDAELAFHEEMRIGELVTAGQTREAAARQARDEFGDIEFTRRYCREVDLRDAREARSAAVLTAWRQDIRFAWRAMRRSPGFALVSLITIALAIGANTAIYSVTRAVLLKPLPYGDPARLVQIDEGAIVGTSAREPVSPPNYTDFVARQRTLSGIVASYSRSVTWQPATGDPEIVDAVNVTANMTTVLGVHPLLGRGFDSDTIAGTTAPRAILAYAFWQRGFGGDPAIVGRTITLNDLSYTVIGVMPPWFTVHGIEALWAPLDLVRETGVADVSRRQHFLQLIGRMKPGMSLTSVNEDLHNVSRQLATEHPDANEGRTATAHSLRSAVVRDLRAAVLLLQAAALLVLLVACVNLTNITLSRTTSRGRELALRSALGAGRGRLVRQLLTESLLLALFGGALGIALAGIATRALFALSPGTVPSMFHVTIDRDVLLVGIALSLGTGLFFGVLPAFSASRTDLQDALKDGGRGSSVGRSGDRLRRALVVAQVSLAVLLLVGAGLLVRSFRELTRVQLGFDPHNVLTGEVRVSGERYDSAGRVNQFYDRVLGDLATTPGVTMAGATALLPTEGAMSSSIVAEGMPSDPNHLPDVQYRLVRGAFFPAMRIPLLAGRDFDASDQVGSPGVVILNQAAARTFLPAGDPIGRRVHLGPDPTAPWNVVIGVVGDVRERGVDAPVPPTVYVSHAQNSWWRSMVIVLRTAADPRSADAPLRRAVRNADPRLALREVRSLDAVIGASLAPRRFVLSLITSFAAVALALAAVGIYGVLAFMVASRKREFGVRLALGATRQGVLLLVLRQGIAWSALGATIGIGGAIAGGRLINGMLYGVGATDPLTYLIVFGSVVLVVGAACVIPATRAMRVDPMTSMRAE